MTREEAIEVLSTYDMSEDNDDTEFKEAIALAIKALEQEPCEDCISRIEVLEQINGWIGSGEYRRTNATWYLGNRINSLPSVQPKTDALDKAIAEIIEEAKSTMNENRAAGLYKAMQIIDRYRQEV